MWQITLHVISIPILLPKQERGFGLPLIAGFLEPACSFRRVMWDAGVARTSLRNIHDISPRRRPEVCAAI